MLNAKPGEPARLPLAPAAIDAILEGSFCAACVINSAGFCDYVNSKFCDLVGGSRSEVLGYGVADILQSVPHSSSKRTRRAPEIHETILRRKNGESIPVRVETRELSPEIPTTGSVMFLENLTDQKHVEEVLRKTERLAAAGRMAAAIAHEINNPLEGVVNLLYLLRNEMLTPEASQYLTLIETEIERVSRIAKQSLAFYRDSSRPTSLDIRELLNMSVDLHAARHPEIQVRRRYRGTIAIPGYASELQQVFHNLIGNAIDAGATRLWLHLHRAKDLERPRRSGLRITIGDDGCGIHPSIRTRIFDPFFTTKGDAGTGLGLWVTRGIILRHEGNIRFRSSIRPGQSGTCFKIFLPG